MPWKAAPFYWIEWKSGNEDWSQNFGQRLTLLTSNSTSYTIPSLTNDIEHSVRVRAIRGNDYGPYSDVVTATPETQPPDKPSVPTLTDGSNDGELNVAWTAPGNGGAAITGYGVQYRKANADKSTAWTDHSHSDTGTTAALTGLTAGARYLVRVRATNSVGSGPWSIASARDAPITTAVVPLKPSTPAATAGNASVTLSWVSGGNGGSAITSWEYSQAVKPAGGSFGEFGSWTTISSSGPATTSTTISSLTNGSTYKFKVRAVNSNGDGAASDESNEATPAVATLAASNITTTGATLTLGIHTAAWAYKQTAPTAGSCTTVAANVKTATVTGLASNTSHTFKAYSDSNCSNELAVATAFLTVPAKPATPTVTRAGSGKLAVASSVTGSGTLSRWEIQRNGGSWTTVNSTAKSLAHTVADLTNDTSYTFKVRAVNATDTGAASDASTATTPAAPTLAASSVEVATATLAIGNYSTAWYYKYTVPTGDTSCTEVSAGTTTKDLTSLTDNTSYTYKAYSDNSCTAANELASVSFTTPAKLAASSITQTTATLTIAGYSGAWSHKQAQPDDPSAPCTTVNSPATTATLTALKAGTSYTWKAYSDSSCTTEYASVTFPTASASTASPSNPPPAFSADIGVASGVVVPNGTPTPIPIYPKLAKSVKEGDTLMIQLPAANGENVTHAVAVFAFEPDDGTASQATGATLNSSSAKPQSPGQAPQYMPLDPEVHDVTCTYDANAHTLSCEIDSPGNPPARLVVVLTATNGEGRSASIAFTIAITLVNNPPEFKNPAQDQTAREDEPFTYTIRAATDPDGDTLTYEVALIGSSSSELPGWLSFTIDERGITFSGTPLEEDTPDTLKIQVTASDDKGGSASVTFTITVEEVNDPPEFKEEAADQTATEGMAFRYTAPIAHDPDHAEEELVYTAFVEQADGELAPLPGWLTFDGDTRMFSGTPGQDDARQIHTILVKVTDPRNLSATTTFRLRVETLYNSRLPQVARQWLARFGRTVSSQVTQSITDRMGDDSSSGRIIVNGQTVNLSADEAAAGEAVAEADDASGDLTGLNGADPFATVAPTTKEAVDEEPVKATATTRDLLLGSSFRLPLNPGGADNRSNGSAKTAGGDRASGSQSINSASGAAVAHDGRGGASGSVTSAKTASGGGWMVWGEAALTNFDGEDGDLVLDGEVLTGVAAIDWQRDRWLAGLALSQSEGEGTFDAPRTDRDDAIQGTVTSSLTALHPYVRYRPTAGLEFWGVAGYGRGTMTLDADDKATDGKTADDEAANPDIWLSTIGIGGRGALLTTEQTGGPAVDLTADVLYSRTGADADVGADSPLRDAVEASTTRVRVGVESAWSWQNADGTSLIPILSTALRYDAGDAETGLGVEVGAGWTYANPGLGLTLSADVRGLLSRQAGDGGLGLREWGGSGSIRYDHGGDGLGLTASLSPSWGVAGSAKDQLWSEIAPPFPTAQGDATADASGGSGNAASNDAMRLEGEIGYGFAAFSGNAVITPYGGLSLADGSRDWRLGGRLTFSPGLAISIEGTRKEQPNNAPDHGVQLDLNTAW